MPWSLCSKSLVCLIGIENPGPPLISLMFSEGVGDLHELLYSLPAFINTIFVKAFCWRSGFSDWVSSPLWPKSWSYKQWLLKLIRPNLEAPPLKRGTCMTETGQWQHSGENPRDCVHDVPPLQCQSLHVCEFSNNSQCMSTVIWTTATRVILYLHAFSVHHQVNRVQCPAQAFDVVRYSTNRVLYADTTLLRHLLWRSVLPQCCTAAEVTVNFVVLSQVTCVWHGDFLKQWHCT